MHALAIALARQQQPVDYQRQVPAFVDDSEDSDEHDDDGESPDAAVASMDVDSGASAAAAADAPAPQIDAAKAAPALSGYYEHAPALGVKNRRARAPAARYGVG